ncbi:glycoside hydrolase superfamily [Filobasidium floriforme]|uniref:glycoside hydrolase superfamily n=1 Tax=Filobasidium floriforme TaxID=5210 RepID=UPI001E8CC644|nr:glycoside hydrolase superfamily [Filobasidium floriforme]KAH8084715.1 glycoside hydrolase superfamily [Filobasidium floriforme]
MAAKFTSPEETTIVSPPPRPPTGPVEGGEPVASAGGSTETTTTTTSSNETPTQAEPQSNQISETALNYRLRAQSSVNLGGWLVTEKWLKPGLYECTGNDKVGELNLAANCDVSKLQEHWDTWITDKDFDALKERGINTVRLPVGYWTVGKANCNCEDSKFWPYIDKYEGQWSYVLKAIDWANQRGMGVLIDLHGAQGSQNTWDHSGESDRKDGVAGFVGSETNRGATKEVIKWIVSQVKDKENVVGIELLNEATEDAGALGSWYAEVASDIQAIAGLDYPIYIFAGFRGSGDYWHDWVQDKPGFWVLDVHPYYLYSSNWKTTTIDQMLDSITKQDTRSLQKLAPNVVLGEWGCAVEGNSTAEHEGFDRVGQYCDAQLELYTSQAAGGWHYWNIHAEGDRSPWDFLSASTVHPGNNRALVRPARNAASFDPAARNDGSHGFSHKRSMLAQRARAHEHRIKRDSYVRHHDDAVEVWDAGCEIGKLFAEAGHVLGFPAEWIRRHGLKHDDYDGHTYREHFTNGVRACQV